MKFFEKFWKKKVSVSEKKFRLWYWYRYFRPIEWTKTKGWLWYYCPNIYTVVKGIGKLKINDYKYQYGSPREDLNVTIMKKEQKLGLQMGPKFNYNPKEDHELILSLHSESKFKIMLYFNIIKSPCKFDEPSAIIYPANDSEPGLEFNLKGIKIFTFEYCKV